MAGCLVEGLSGWTKIGRLPCSPSNRLRWTGPVSSRPLIAFLAFAPAYSELAEKLANVVTLHATPVGGGTVARTECIPISKRAQAAVIAWMRHRTTAYDQMKIPQIKGKRRETRRLLAERPRKLLEADRAGRPVDEADCPLQGGAGGLSGDSIREGRRCCRRPRPLVLEPISDGLPRLKISVLLVRHEPIHVHLPIGVLKCLSDDIRGNDENIGRSLIPLEVN